VSVVAANLVRVAAEWQLPAPARNLGPGWRALVTALDRDLRRLTPAACVTGYVGADGLLALALYDGACRAGVEAACHEVLRAAGTTCELCGARGTARAGLVLTVRCDRCTGAGGPERATTRPMEER
jgi:hypothetical protein